MDRRISQIESVTLRWLHDYEEYYERTLFTMNIGFGVPPEMALFMIWNGYRPVVQYRRDKAWTNEEYTTEVMTRPDMLNQKGGDCEDLNLALLGNTFAHYLRMTYQLEHWCCYSVWAPNTEKPHHVAFAAAPTNAPDKCVLADLVEPGHFGFEKPYQYELHKLQYTYERQTA